MTYKEPDKIFAISGRDGKTGDIILKIVNAGDAPYRTTLQLAGVTRIDKEADLTTLAASEGSAENSFVHPTGTVPVISSIHDASSEFELTLPPFSVNVLRLKTRR